MRVSNLIDNITGLYIKIGGIGKIKTDVTYTERDRIGQRLLKAGQDSEGPSNAKFKWEFELGKEYLMTTVEWRNGRNTTTGLFADKTVSRIVYKGNFKYSSNGALESWKALDTADVFYDGAEKPRPYSGGVTRRKASTPILAPFTLSKLDQETRPEQILSEISYGISSDDKGFPFRGVTSMGQMPQVRDFENKRFFYNGWDSNAFGNDLI
jgi:hypothetical protein